jgi:hypothetical protein
MTNEELRELVFMALGEASVCWKQIPYGDYGEFDSERAVVIGERLIAQLQTGCTDA